MAFVHKTSHHHNMALRRLALYGVMAVLTAVAAYVGARIAGPSGAVVGAVSGVGISAVGEAGRRWFDYLENLRKIREQTFVQEIATHSTSSELSPAVLLTPEQATVPFIGREQELRELTNWCVRQDSAPLHVLVGGGGTGKTRLARELAARLKGWDCRWVQQGQEAEAINAARRRKALIIVDYAETRPRGNLARLVRHLAWPRARQKIRVLMIARAIGDWWADLAGETQSISERNILRNTKRTTLHVLEGDQGSYSKYYNTAIHAFCEKLSIPLVPTGVVAPHDDESILMVQIAALVAVLDSNEQPSAQRGELLSRLLDHEDRYWQRSAESCGLSWLSRTARYQSVAELCLSGSTTVEDAAKLLKRVPELADSIALPRYNVARWLQNLYPGEGGYQLSLLRPHLLAEHLVVRELSANVKFAESALHNLSEDMAHHTLTMLGYAATHERQAIRLALEVVEADPTHMILPAVYAAVETGASLDAAIATQISHASLSLRQLVKISAAIPLRSESLDRAAVVVRNRLLSVSEEELRRLEMPSADLNEMEWRQIELIEFARVFKYFRDKKRALPRSIRAQLLKALEIQKDTLSQDSRQFEVENISREIAWIESHPPSA